MDKLINIILLINVNMVFDYFVEPRIDTKKKKCIFIEIANILYSVGTNMY